MRRDWAENFEFLFYDFDDLLVCGSYDLNSVFFWGEFVFAFFNDGCASLANNLA